MTRHDAGMNRERVPSATGTIPITRPLLGDEEVDAVADVLRSGWLAQGPRVAEFERRVASYLGTHAAVATSSCTTALNLAVLMMDLAPGDEVLVPAFTWVATPNAVELAGAKPVFVDIELDTFNIDPEAAEHAITDRTVGMLPVHLFGLAASMEPLLRLATQRGLWVIEDAACALGTRYGNVHVGTLGDVGCFSFHPRKSISTGEGGLIVGRDEARLERARSLRNHGVEPDSEPTMFGDLPDHPAVGFNYRMTDLQAAIGLVQMDRLDGILIGRRQAASSYDTLLSDVPWLKRPPLAEGHSFQSYVCIVAPTQPTLDNVGAMHAQRSSLMGHLKRMGVETRPGTHAPVRMTYYRNRYGLDDGAFPNAIIADRASVALPLFAGMDPREIEFVASAVQEAPVG
jgi:perosamine synthetase